MQPHRYVHPNQQTLSSAREAQPWANPALRTAADGAIPQCISPIARFFPADTQTQAQCGIPMALVVAPARAGELETVDCSKSPPPRCCGCRGFIGARVAGDEWRCPLCGAVTKAARAAGDSSAFALHSRYEARAAAYDIAVPETKVYRFRDIEPRILFVVDASRGSVASGFTRALLSSIRASLRAVPDSYKVGLVRMGRAASVLDVAAGAEVVVADLSERQSGFALRGALARKGDCAAQLERAIDALMGDSGDGDAGNCLGDALTLAGLVLGAEGGIVVAGFTGLPAYGLGALGARTGDESTLLKLPKDGSGNFYRDLAYRFNGSAISVYMFTAGNDFKDLSVVGVPAGLTSGRLFNYGALDETAFQQMHNDIYRVLTNKYCWEVSMKLRCSGGIKLENVFANCIIKTGNVVSMPIMDEDSAIAFKLKICGNVPQKAVFQLSFVFTDNFKNKRIRVFTFSIPTTSDVSVIRNNVDEAVLMTIITKYMVSTILSKGMREEYISVKERLNNMLKSNTNFVSLKYLVHSLLSNIAIRNIPHPLGVDGRMSNLILLRSINITNLLLYLYPRMFSLDSNEYELLPLTGQSFGHGNCFLVHTINRIYIWISQSVSTEFLMNTFNVNDFNNEMPQNVENLNLNTHEYEKLRELINDCWVLSGCYLPVEIIKQGEPRESVFGEILVDDLNVY